MSRIVIDTLGAERGIEVVISAVLESGTEDMSFFLVGNEKELKQSIEDYISKNNKELFSEIGFIQSNESIGMNENPKKILKNENYSICKAAKDVVENGGLLIAPGNTGASAFAALKYFDKLSEKIRTPPIAVLYPKPDADSTVFLDAGGNTSCTSRDLVCHFILGYHLAKHMINDNPVGALLNIGEEECKGTETEKEAHNYIMKMIGKGFPKDSYKINKDGKAFAEGYDLWNGSLDFVVDNGVDGNKNLKSAEGALNMIFSALQKRFAGLPLEYHKKVFDILKNAVQDYGMENRAGGFLLGLEHPIIIMHGNSTKNSFKGAINLGNNYVDSYELMKTETKNDLEKYL